MDRSSKRSFGFLTYPDLYYSGGWDNVTISIALTIDIWVQITNATKNLYSTLYANGFHLANDKIIADCSGLFNIQFQPNGIGQDNKTWEYRIIVQRGVTQYVAWQYSVQGAGKTVLRNVQTDYYLQVNDQIWVEMRSTSITPGTVEYYKMKITLSKAF